MKLVLNTGNLILTLCLFLVAGGVHADNHARTLVQELNSGWNMHFNNADAKALASLYAEDAIVSPGNGKTLNGRAAIQDLFKGFFENGLHNHSIETIKSVREGNVITQVARWQANGPESDGNKPVFGGILMSVLKQEDNGEWKTHIHIWNMAS